MLSVALLSQFEPPCPVQPQLAPTCSSLGSDLLCKSFFLGFGTKEHLRHALLIADSGSMRKLQEICSHLTRYYLCTLVMAPSEPRGQPQSQCGKEVRSVYRELPPRRNKRNNYEWMLTTTRFSSWHSESVPHEPWTIRTMDHTNLQGTNFQRWEHVFHQSQAGEKPQLAPSPITDGLSALPSPTSPLPPSQKLFWPVHSMPGPVCQLLYCTTLLHVSRYCTIRSKMFSLFFVFFNVLFVWKVL